MALRLWKKKSASVPDGAGPISSPEGGESPSPTPDSRLSPSPRVSQFLEEIQSEGGSALMPFFEALRQAPEVGPLFAETSLTSLGNAFTNALKFLETGEPKKLTDYLRRLGTRHQNYGVTTEHFEAFEDQFLSWVAERMGEEWDESLRREWSEWLQALAHSMGLVTPS